MENDHRNIQHVEDKKLYKTADFSGVDQFEYILKKTEKLASAVYLVTNYFPENESLKVNLRNKSAALVSFIAVNAFSEVFYPNFSTEIQRRIVEIVSMFEVAKNVGFVSSMNFEIITTEYNSLAKFVKDNPRLDLNESAIFSEGYFDVNTGLIGHSYTGSTTSVQNRHIDTEKIKTPVVDGEFKKSSRQNTILALLKKRKDLTIKDISVVIRNCSEKTIQRELVSLIATGLVKRSGERRWSKYSLV